MRLDATLIREDRDRKILPLLRRELHEPHRPRTRYRLVIGTADEAEVARREGLPVFPIRDDVITMLGYPMRFPGLLVVARAARSAVETDLPVVEFLSERAVARPRLEDVMIAMLRFDPLAARALIHRNGDLVDPAYLAKRIYQEDLEEEATRVRLHELLPFEPVGEMLPAAAIAKADRANRPEGLLP
jgi:hypothetical protein